MGNWKLSDAVSFLATLGRASSLFTNPFDAAFSITHAEHG
jgi:methylmalonyl-CoA mutase N-terminal domain/subunit